MVVFLFLIIEKYSNLRRNGAMTYKVPQNSFKWMVCPIFRAQKVVKIDYFTPLFQTIFLAPLL
jgi:hypothetical protein